MNNTKTPSRYGYWIHHMDVEDAKPHNRLEIIISEEATELHFDPHRVIFSVISKGEPLHLVVTHPWHLKKTYGVSAGFVEMIDQKGNKKEVLTFGGTVTIHPHDDDTTIYLESEAPLIEMGSSLTVPHLFIDEAKILLAERKAAYKQDEDQFYAHIDQAAPAALYAGIVLSLDQRFMRRKERLDIDQKLLDFLHAEKRRLTENRLIPANVFSIEDVV